jgi:hypothetical protein
VISDELPDALAVWLTSDLSDYLAAISGMFAEAEAILLYDPDRFATLELDPDDYDLDTAYGQLLDPNHTKGSALPWLAQFVGERFPVGIGEDAQREWILDHPNARRGTLRSLANAAQRSLIGQRFVTIVERNDGGVTDAPDDVSIYVYADECPDPAQVLHDLADTFPLELSLNFQVITATTWQQVRLNYATWTDVKAKTWGQLMSGRLGGVYPGGQRL